MRKLLSDCGFSGIVILNSPLPEGDPNRLFYCPNFAQSIKRSLHVMAKTFEVISARKILLGTSLELTAFKGTSHIN